VRGTDRLVAFEARVLSTPRAAALRRSSRLRGFASDHHFSRLDDRQRIVAPTKLQFGECVAGYNRGQPLIADSQANLANQAIDSHFFDEASKPVPAAQSDDKARGLRRLSRGTWTAWRLPRKKALDLCFREAVVTAFGLRRADLALIDPLLERRISNTQPLGGGSDG
jgi:hypothetical protein